METSDDTSSYWQIRGRTGTSCHRGQPIKCGVTIRLTHLSTRRNLHSHSSYDSPLSQNQEVSAFGNQGEGDNGDDWIVVCENIHWLRSEAVQLRHAVSGSYLAVSGQQYSRPIEGQLEVCTVKDEESVGCHWQASEGVFVKPVENQKPFVVDKHDEL